MGNLNETRLVPQLAIQSLEATKARAGNQVHVKIQTNVMSLVCDTIQDEKVNSIPGCISRRF